MLSFFQKTILLVYICRKQNISENGTFLTFTDAEYIGSPNPLPNSVPTFYICHIYRKQNISENSTFYSHLQTPSSSALPTPSPTVSQHIIYITNTDAVSGSPIYPASGHPASGMISQLNQVDTVALPIPPHIHVSHKHHAHIRVS